MVWVSCGFLGFLGFDCVLVLSMVVCFVISGLFGLPLLRFVADVLGLVVLVLWVGMMWVSCGGWLVARFGCDGCFERCLQWFWDFPWFSCFLWVGIIHILCTSVLAGCLSMI